MNITKLGKGAVALKSKEKLKAQIKEDVTKLFTEVLDLAEVSVDGRGRYEALRGKILTKGNDTWRVLHKELDLYYNVEYVPNKETVIIPSVKDNGEE